MNKAELRYLPAILLAVAAGYLAAGWLWKRAFVWGESGGPYWLFIVMDWTVLPLALVSFLGFVCAVAVWLLRGTRRAPSFRSAALASGVLLLASLSFLAASFPLLISLMTPLDSLTANGRVYRLSGIMALADENYALLECDRYGLICRQIYRSGDYSSAEQGRAGMAYDGATNTLSVTVGRRGTVHTYRPPLPRASADIERQFRYTFVTTGSPSVPSGRRLPQPLSLILPSGFGSIPMAAWGQRSSSGCVSTCPSIASWCTVAV